MIHLKVCVGTSCHINGGYNVISTFQHMIEEYGLHDKVAVDVSFCMRECAKSGVSVMVDDKPYRVEPEKARTFFTETVFKLTNGQTILNHAD